jgi:mono/diheme cytochrome c family protein
MPVNGGSSEPGFARRDRSGATTMGINGAVSIALAICTGVLSMSTASNVHAQSLRPPERLPDTASGRDLSVRLCTNCHIVAAGATGGPGQLAPPFAEIARKPGQNAERVAGAIIIPHPDMPAVSLTMQEIRDVVGYIMSLKPPQ